MNDCCGGLEAGNVAERRTLGILLAINGLMFVFEFSAGLLAYSAGLLADSLDMLADASVYGISLYAVGRSRSRKVAAARLSGRLQVLLGLGVLVGVARRLLYGSDPESLWMLGVGTLALAANLACLALLARHRKGEVHMRASWIFSANDVLANLGVIVSGALVLVTASNWPDLVVGLVISALVISGGVRILREANRSP